MPWIWKMLIKEMSSWWRKSNLNALIKSDEKTNAAYKCSIQILKQKHLKIWTIYMCWNYWFNFQFFLNKPLFLFQRSNVPVCQCFDVSKFKCSNVSMFQCSNVPMFQCFNVSMFQCFNVSMFQCSNVQIFKC